MRERMATPNGIENNRFLWMKRVLWKKKEEKLEEGTKRIPRIQCRECDRFARSVPWNNTLMAAVFLIKFKSYRNDSY